jgi:hypothetical protein
MNLTREQPVDWSRNASPFTEYEVPLPFSQTCTGPCPCPQPSPQRIIPFVENLF